MLTSIKNTPIPPPHCSQIFFSPFFSFYYLFLGAITAALYLDKFVTPKNLPFFSLFFFFFPSGGAITAALYLDKFVTPKNLPWIHMVACICIHANKIYIYILIVRSCYIMYLQISINIFIDIYQYIYRYLSICLQISINIVTDIYQYIYRYLSIQLQISINIFIDIYQYSYRYLSIYKCTIVLYAEYLQDHYSTVREHILQ